MITTTTAQPSTMSSALTLDELDYLLSLSESELECWINGFSLQEKETILQEMLWRQEQISEHQNPVHLVRSKAELADELGISLPTLQKYVRLGMPGAATPYDVRACQEWIAEYRSGGSGRDQSGNSMSLVPARLTHLETRTRRDIISAELESIELEARKGTILLADDVMSLLRQVASVSVTILAGIEDAIDRELPEKCPSEEVWREMRDRAILAGRRIAADVASQLQRLVERDAE